ncbi:Pimeloyl-ACP methyl ester carboxylesterase [Shimia gijangensis]|uniref:Pimeloyl-ACP methyl ester carboxylesterase n=1 Tax=Shimia gijangensis TaxID=1470563 RepID=A0A1M6ETJ3_9RHOB|nr:alpha/beta fold hydrolase [Shimia gijangensis]SHI88706.1 Pimeloyl-ACP methyl ester carboxylesterase [Shimia gijangensis]
MPRIDVNGTRMHYTDTGEGTETIVFSHGLLFSGAMFEAQVEHFSKTYRCITFDHRGQGQSEVTDSGYDIDTLTDDASALIEKLGVGPCHFVGLSMGGFVGMRLAARRPDLLKSLILLETSADPEPEENHGKYKKLNFVARWIGLWAVINQVMPIMFSQSFLNDATRDAEKAKWKKAIVGNNRIGITRAVMGVVNRLPIYDELDEIVLPTLVIVGEEDVATVPAKAERIHRAINGSRLIYVPRAGHSATIEQPVLVNTAIDEFLQKV